ncbi:unnamed protein product [Haemonchus placei]|uniref:Spindle and centriole-associated protein 1 n=1 Tax=Haemonchus placei TaxID=6290 RepID=A0A0N4X6P2_HAEPC|nr:unnamed protein product [Haemonchus placei]
MEALKVMNTRLEQLLRAQQKGTVSVDSSPSSPGSPPPKELGFPQSKEEPKSEKYEKKRRRTPPDVTFADMSLAAVPSKSSPIRQRTTPRVTIAEEPNVMAPSIVFDLVDQNGGTAKKNEEPTQRSRHMPTENVDEKDCHTTVSRESL